MAHLSYTTYFKNIGLGPFQQFKSCLKQYMAFGPISLNSVDGPWPIFPEKRELGYITDVYRCIRYIYPVHFGLFEPCILFENEFSRFHLYFPYYFSAFVPYARFNSLFLNFTQIRHPCTLNLQFVFFTPIWYKTFVYQCIQVVYRPVLQLSTAEK